MHLEDKHKDLIKMGKKKNSKNKPKRYKLREDQAQKDTK